MTGNDDILFFLLSKELSRLLPSRLVLNVAEPGQVADGDSIESHKGTFLVSALCCLCCVLAQGTRHGRTLSERSPIPSLICYKGS